MDYYRELLMGAESPNRIGNLNGPWSIMFRLALATYPLLMAWAVWMTANQFADIAFRTSGDRFTARDGATLEAKLLDRIVSGPSDEWKARVLAAEKFQADVLTRLIRIETKLESK